MYFLAYRETSLRATMCCNPLFKNVSMYAGQIFYEISLYTYNDREYRTYRDRPRPAL